MSQVIKNICDGLLNLIYEPSCPFELESSCSLREFCSADGWTKKVCGLCFNELVDLEIPARPVEDNLLVHSAALYKDDAKKILHRFKWVEPKLAKPIAELMVYKFSDVFAKPSFDFIVYVPGLLSQERDWIPSHLLAKELSSILKIPVFNDLLIKTQETKLHKLSLEQRLEIVKTAYSRNNFSNDKVSAFDSTPKNILLIDDLITSGATISFCSSEIKKGNPEHKITGLTFLTVPQS